MDVCQPQCTGSPLIPTSICSGTATMPYPTNIVLSTHYYIEPQYLFQPRSARRGTNTHKQSFISLQISCIGHQQDEVKNSTPRTAKNNKGTRTNTINRSFITVPCSKGLSDSFKNICKRYGIQVHFKSGKTLKDELVAPKDKDHITKKSGIIYRLECDEEHIEETSRTFGERFKEHLKAPPQFMTTVTPHVILPHLKILA